MTRERLHYNSEVCPYCKKSLLGEPYEEVQQAFLSGEKETRTVTPSLVIGVTDIHRDRIGWWRCPFCGEQDLRE